MDNGLLFVAEKKERKSRRVLMHVIDAGCSPFENGHICAMFKCKKCGFETGWRHGFKTVTEINKGIPCETCNPRNMMEGK